MSSCNTLENSSGARAPSDDGYLVKGGTGFGVRTLLELVTGFEVPTGPVNSANGNGAAAERPAKRAAAKKAPAKKTAAKKTATKKVAARRTRR